MAEYGRDPDNQNRSWLLTGGIALTGLFALGRSLRPWANKVILSEAREFVKADKIDTARMLERAAQLSQGNKNKAFQDVVNNLRDLGVQRTGESSALGAYLEDKGVPEANTIQALGMAFSRSTLMSKWQGISKHVMPLQLADKLLFGRELREMYGTKEKPLLTSQRLGTLENLGILRPEELDKVGGHRSVFYVGGKVFHVGDSRTNYDVQELPGQFFLYGRAGKGEPRSVLEKLRADLQGVSADPERLLQMRDSMQWRMGEDLAAGLLKIDSEEYKQRIHSINKIEQVISRHTSTSNLNKARRFFDLGLNERGETLFSEGGFRKFKQTLGGLIDPANVPEERHLGATREGKNPNYGIMRSFSFNRKSFRDAVLGGRDNQINTGTLAAYHLFDRVNTVAAWNGIAPWLAMSGKSTTFEFGDFSFGGPAAYVSNLLLKRALPLFAATFYAGYINDMIGQTTGQRPTDSFVLGIDAAQLHIAGLKDQLGISREAARLDELSSGVLSHIAHPFVEGKVGLSQAELQDEFDNGRTAVRKGRWWAFGSSTSFRGERVQYYTPNMHQQALAGDVYKTSTLFGSNNEYYQNAALPTPTSPFAPFNHFVFDKYHYEKKHYRDRPYPLSAPLFEPTSLWGAVLNPILGPIFKPTVAMHQDDMPYIISGPNKGQINPKYKHEIKSLNEQIIAKADATPVSGYVTPSGEISPMGRVATPGSFRILEEGNQQLLDDSQDADDGTEGDDYVVPYGSGKVKNRKLLRRMNQSTKEASRFSKESQLEPSMAPGLFRQTDPNDKRALRDMISSYDPRYQAGIAYYSATEIGGLYGFGAVTFTGDQYADLPTVQNAGRMTGFERTYWDRYNSGGMLPTPGLSEIFRRFMPHRYHTNTEYNPIRNTMPTWLPGQGGEDPAYFVDFLHGDPYVAIPNGEVRLPGESYEKLHGIPSADLSIRSTQVGYGEEQIYQFLTQDHAPFAAYSEEIAEKGAQLHRDAISGLRASHNLLGTNVDYNYDGIKGSIDAVTSGEGGPSPLEIHTVSGRRYRDLSNEGKDDRYERQLQVDMAAIGATSASLLYINRDDPSQQITLSRTLDKNLLSATLGDVQAARSRVYSGIASGQFGPGQFYDDITKLEILGDVAPWSNQYRRYRDYITHLPEDQLSEDDRMRLKRVKAEVTERKKRYQFSPYKLKYADLEYHNVTVKDVIDPNTFTTLENPDNPIRLAGVHIGVDNADKVAKYIHSGAHLRIGYAQDPVQQISNDTLHTIRSVVYSGNTQINKNAIDEGYGTEKKDESPAGLRVQYTGQELAYGAMLESFGHMPINIGTFHNKFMPIDSPLELYKRTQVYGKDWQDWRHPFRDYLFPSYEAFSTQGIAGLVGAAVLGYALGTGKLFNKGKFQPRAAMVAASMLAVEAVGLARGHNPIPSYREKERDTKEYFDILKFIKFQGLYEKTRAYIMKHEHKDIGAIIDHYKKDGDTRKKRILDLKEEKRKLIVGGGKKRSAARIKEINNEISELQSYRRELSLTRDDVLAIQYKNVADSTLYGATPGGDMRKVLMALDPKEREYFNQFLKAKGPEREEILKLVPHNEKRFLQAAYGLHPDEKPELAAYFKDHYLPPADWTGWKAEANLNDYKLVVMKQEGLDMTAAGYWPQDEARVREQRTPDIMPYRETDGNVRNRIRATLNGLGLRDTDIQIARNNQTNNQINLRVMQEQQIQNQNLLAN